jgi:hypothetical protein
MLLAALGYGLAIGLTVWALLSMPRAAAAPSATDEVCILFNAGVPADQIPGMLHRGDGRENYWRGVHDSVWPIIEGECDDR